MNETTEQELELVKEGYRAFERGDLQWVLEHFHTDILVEDRFESPDAAVFRGHDGFLTYLEGWLSAWEEFRMEPTRFVPAGDKILVLVHQIGRGKGSKMEIEEDVAHLWTVRDATAVGYRVYSDQLEALRGLGGRNTLHSLEAMA